MAEQGYVKVTFTVDTSALDAALERLQSHPVSRAIAAADDFDEQMRRVNEALAASPSALEAMKRLAEGTD